MTITNVDLAPKPGAQDTATYDHIDDVGSNTAIAAASVERAIFVLHEITETLGGGATSPSFTAGYTGSLTTFANVTSGAAGTQGFSTGILPAGEALLVTVTDGTGGSEAGKVKFSFIAVPTS